MMSDRVRHYFQEPTPARFHVSDKFVRGIRGPFGSGKSVGCVMEIVMRAFRQVAGPDGRRRSRWAIVRNTYGELKTTTIKTWQDWIPDDICPIVYDAPIRGEMTVKQPDGTTVELEVLFVALDRPDHVRKLLSLELTGCWINEARWVPLQILEAMTGRVGRFPAKIDGGSSWSGIIMDTNPPDTDHWWYRFAELETPEGWEFFAQPPAIIYDNAVGVWKPNPLAENVNNHTNGYEYWLRQVPGKVREWIKVYLCGEYGAVLEGKVVYPEYNDDIHYREAEIAHAANLPLGLGFDFGLTPAVVFGQVTPRGRLIVMDELCAESMGIRQFLRDVVIPLLHTRYKDIRRILVVGDPAGNSRAPTDESTCFDELRAAGFQPTAAPSNAFLPRREAVAGFLTKLVDGQPGFVLGPRCRKLRKGFLGGYNYRRIAVGGADRFKDEPDKNEYSHPHDALQYLAMMSSSLAVTLPNEPVFFPANDTPPLLAGAM